MSFDWLIIHMRTEQNSTPHTLCTCRHSRSHTVMHPPPSATIDPHTHTVKQYQCCCYSTGAAGCESVLCLAKEIVYFESVLGLQRVNKYLMTVPPLLSAQAQADDLLTFRHPGLDELLRTELSVTSAGPTPGGIEWESYLWSHLAQMSISRTPPADWTLWLRAKRSFSKISKIIFAINAQYQH